MTNHESKRLYVYESDREPGWLKVGQTDTGNSLKRVKAQTTGAGTATFNIVYETNRNYVMGEEGTFSDRDILKRLEKAGFMRHQPEGGRKREWVNADLDAIKRAIDDEKNRRPYDSSYERSQIFKLRPEQESAVLQTRQEFAKARTEKRKGRMLWNAKMRFGKTMATYQLAKRENFKRVLVVTYIPAVGKSWQEDLESHVDFKGWTFSRASDEDLVKTLENSSRSVTFCSLQDLMGRTKPDSDEGKEQIKAKNKVLHETSWDMVVFDEYHYGAWREGAKEMFATGEGDEVTELHDEKTLAVKADNFLYLSGTAFRAMDSGEFQDSQIFQWTYPDEQRAKKQWVEDHPNEPRHENPYDALPQMHLVTFKLDDTLTQQAQDEDGGFNLSMFFEAGFDANNKPYFKLENAVSDWLRLISGRRQESRMEGGDKAVWPFSSGAEKLVGNLRHTVWYLPSVAACFAMKEMLEKDKYFGNDYKIIVAAGKDAGLGEAALPPVREAITKEPHKTRTITLTCGKLTTGVTVPEWTGIFMLRALSAPESYFQSAFRVQSPWLGNIQNGIRPVRKRHAFVFDFAPQRALRIIADYTSRISSGSNVKAAAEEIIEVLPILAWDGNRMAEINAQDLLDMAVTGTSARLLAKRWESALLVNLDSQILGKVLKNDALMRAINSIIGHRRLTQSKNDLTFLINSQSNIAELKKKKSLASANGKSLSKNDLQKLSTAEKEYRNKRDEIREKLIKFSTRIPLFMYLSEHRELALIDVIRNVEPGLFETVTGLTVEQFDSLVEIGLFNREMMNSAVFSFKTYEDGSLDYIQLPGRAKMLADQEMGLFSTIMSKEDAKVAYGE